MLESAARRALMGRSGYMHGSIGREDVISGRASLLGAFDRLRLSQSVAFFALIILTLGAAGIVGRAQPTSSPANPVAVSPGPSPQIQSVEAADLRLGQAVERELKAKETQAFRLELKAGEYMKLAVTTRGSNLRVEAIAPG